MLLHLILGSTALMAGMFSGGLLLVVVGIRRADRGKRLYGKPVGRAESFARRLLTGSRGYADDSAKTDRSDETRCGR
jgi:hypothetical protein